MAPTRIRSKKVDALPEHLRPRKSPTQARARALVDAVLEAGSRILIERGYQGLSMQQVARRAGVSPGSLYQYFPDKPALVAALIDRISQEEVAFHAQTFSALPPDAPLELVFETTIRSVLGFQRRQGPLMRALLGSLPWLGRYPALSDRVRQTAGFLRALLEPRAAQLPMSPELATHVLANALHSLTHDGILSRPEWLDDETLVREAMRLVRGYLGLT
ncbi:MAG: TetR/AcrR family transcriptional regulator [Myxococcaceae bacterium]